jgi:hypothetical protein
MLKHHSLTMPVRCLCSRVACNPHHRGSKLYANNAPSRQIFVLWCDRLTPTVTQRVRPLQLSTLCDTFHHYCTAWPQHHTICKSMRMCIFQPPMKLVVTLPSICSIPSSDVCSARLQWHQRQQTNLLANARLSHVVASTAPIIHENCLGWRWIYQRCWMSSVKQDWDYPRYVIVGHGRLPTTIRVVVYQTRYSKLNRSLMD